MNTGLKNSLIAGHQWLTLVIPATQEVKIRRIVVPSQPEQIVCETPISKTQNMADGVVQVVE
jgi:hypothetical protein